MLSEATKRMIENACVTVRKGEGHGRGFLVEGHLVLTAAHCVNYETEGGMVLGDYYLQEIETRQGGVLRVGPKVVEPVSDIAAFGALDGQVFLPDEEAFDAWCDTTQPLPLCLDDFPLFKPIPVYVYTHTSVWLEGVAQQYHPEAHMLSVTMPGIEAGTSGSPIVTSTGAVVGVFSHMSEQEGAGLTPRPHLTLPVWVMRQIQADEASQEETRRRLLDYVERQAKQQDAP
jgi:hypothetical protein